MFKDVGKEIKTWAKVIVIIHAIVCAVLGFYIGVLYESPILSFLLLIVFGVGGFFLGRLSAIVLYAFGEMVDCIQYIAKEMKKPWVCNECGHENQGADIVCELCGRSK